MVLAVRGERFEYGEGGSGVPPRFYPTGDDKVFSETKADFIAAFRVENFNEYLDLLDRAGRRILRRLRWDA